MHQSKVWNSKPLVKIQPWVQDDCHHLKNGKDNCKEAVDGSDGSNTVNVKNVRGKGDQEVEAGPNSEDSCSLPEESTAMRLLIRMRVRGLDEIRQEVDEEQAGDHQHVQQEIACLNFSMILKRLCCKLVDGNDNIHSDGEEAVEAGEAACDAADRAGGPWQV